MNGAHRSSKTTQGCFCFEWFGRNVPRMHTERIREQWYLPLGFQISAAEY